MARTLTYIVVADVTTVATLIRVRQAVGRPWLDRYRDQVRFWVQPEDVETERTELALAGLKSTVESFHVPTEK